MPLRSTLIAIRHIGHIGRVRQVSAACCALTLAAPAAAAAQARPSARGDTAWSRPGAAVTGRDLVAAGAFAVAAGALMPFDARITHWSQRPSLQQNGALRNTATVFRNLGDPGTIILSVATYGSGLVLHDRAMADIGLHATGAIAVSGAVTAIIKGTLGRARPYAVADSNSHDYALGRGLRKGSAYASLPSGHTSAAFALAAAVASETRHRAPHAAHVVTPVAYGAATLVALSRVYNDDHWASDIALAAGIGTVSGLAVVRYQHARPHNALDRRLLPSVRSVSRSSAAAPAARRTSAVPLAVSWTLRFR